MKKSTTEGWKIRCVFVSFEDGKRIETPREEISPEGMKEIAINGNRRALKAAGYVPVNECKKEFTA